MSRIIEKAFNAGKKIVKSIFRGAPNLITTSDLNRQIDALKYQMDKLDEKTCVTSDCQVTASISGTSLSVSVEYTYIRHKGCEFSPSEKNLGSILFDRYSPRAYICLTANTDTITYEADSSHDIAGAKFEDGTSYPAADQVVYKNERLFLSNNIQDAIDSLGVLAVIEWTGSTTPIVRSNCVKEGESLGVRQSGSIGFLDGSVKGGLRIGDSYDTAFSKINNKFPANTSWASLGNYFRYRLINGVLVVESLTTAPLKIAPSLYPYGFYNFGKLDDTILNCIKELYPGEFSRPGILDPSEPDDTKLYYPFGELCSFSFLNSGESESCFGYARLSLGIQFDDTSNSIGGVHLILYTGIDAFKLSASKITVGSLQSQETVINLRPTCCMLPLFRFLG